ncbi:DUF916 and DUF3324 domain-containing protein [Vagococcus sp. BWB3-3]|uniref:DUF916 and DUF3324 domain-containing protein n=1 Tax=Vagococcus allomyrinae TaxID=2794353 RepID=A0A940P9N8_9ENTE|nr:DUF916 and DUF3324 domain-containing protein [Vagococcus allomyrinae]MBP1043595.1 DUF916 and DUF3324 domain-containing protein [Vagococcus allomyrinae]
MITQAMKRLMVVVSMAGIMIVGLFFPGRVLADETTENVVGFNYKVEYPENQLGTNKGYFDLVLSPGQEQVVNITLSNPGKEKIAVDVLLNGTKTNPNGVIEYGVTEIENDASLKFPFEEIVSGPESVELAGGEVKNLELTIKMPATSFEGVVLGGIQMRKANQETGEVAQGATVKNEYSYVVAMVLKNNEADVPPEIQINKASGSQRNFRNSVVINLSNIQPFLVTNKLAIETQIMKKGAQEVLYERKQTGMSIAPNSQMDFFVSMNGEQMIPGDYTANVLATIDDQKWEKKLDFKITKEEADKYNKRDVGLVQDRGLDWKMVALIVGGILVVVIVIFVSVRMVQKGQKKANGKSEAKFSSRKSSGKKR